MNKVLYGHVDIKSAYVIDDYPYSRLRTKMNVWVETHPKRGDRVYRQTQNPKTGRWNKPKVSTYFMITFLFLDEKNHVVVKGLNEYADEKEVQLYIKTIGIKNLNKYQLEQYKKLTGEAVVNYKLKWERRPNDKKLYQVRLRIDRGSSLTRDRLTEMFIEIFSDSKYKKNIDELIDNNGSIIVYSGTTPLTSPFNIESIIKQLKIKR